MELKVIGSGSEGNCYVLETINEALVIEAGIPFMFLKRALNFSIAKIAGAIITHEHGDHAGHVTALIKNGIRVGASEGTLKAKEILNKPFTEIMVAGKMAEFGGFKVLPFGIDHDAEEPLGFIINHPESGNILFVNDTHHFTNQTPNLNHIIIEANYDEEKLNRLTNGTLAQRIRETHMGIKDTQNYLEKNKANLKNVNNIVLVHLSNTNSDAPLFKHLITVQTGILTTIAEKGMTINFNKNKF